MRALHGSRENRTDLPRPLLLFSYVAVDAWPLIKECALEEFDSRILRGEPTLAPRQVALPVRLPLPRVETHDSIFDNQDVISGRSFGPPEAPAVQSAEAR